MGTLATTADEVLVMMIYLKIKSDKFQCKLTITKSLIRTK